MSLPQLHTRPPPTPPNPHTDATTIIKTLSSSPLASLPPRPRAIAALGIDPSHLVPAKSSSFASLPPEIAKMRFAFHEERRAKLAALVDAEAASYASSSPSSSPTPRPPSSPRSPGASPVRKTATLLRRSIGSPQAAAAAVAAVDAELALEYENVVAGEEKRMAVAEKRMSRSINALLRADAERNGLEDAFLRKQELVEARAARMAAAREEAEKRQAAAAAKREEKTRTMAEKRAAMLEAKKAAAERGARRAAHQRELAAAAAAKRLADQAAAHEAQIRKVEARREEDARRKAEKRAVREAEAAARKAEAQRARTAAAEKARRKAKEKAAHQAAVIARADRAAQERMDRLRRKESEVNRRLERLAAKAEAEKKAAAKERADALRSAAAARKRLEAEELARKRAMVEELEAKEAAAAAAREEATQASLVEIEAARLRRQARKDHAAMKVRQDAFRRAVLAEQQAQESLLATYVDSKKAELQAEKARLKRQMEERTMRQSKILQATAKKKYRTRVTEPKAARAVAAARQRSRPKSSSSSSPRARRSAHKIRPGSFFNVLSTNPSAMIEHAGSSNPGAGAGAGGGFQVAQPPDAISAARALDPILDRRERQLEFRPPWAKSR